MKQLESEGFAYHRRSNSHEPLAWITTATRARLLKARIGLVHHWPAFAACAIRPSEAARCARFRSAAATCTARLPQGEMQPCSACHLFPSSLSETARIRTTYHCGQTARQENKQPRHCNRDRPRPLNLRRHFFVPAPLRLLHLIFIDSCCGMFYCYNMKSKESRGALHG